MPETTYIEKQLLAKYFLQAVFGFDTMIVPF